MPLLVIILTSDLIQVPVVLHWWLITVAIVLIRRIGHINSCRWGEAWKSEAAKAIIMTTSSIASIVPTVTLMSIWGLGILRELMRLGFRLLRPGRVPVDDLFLSTFVCLRGRLMAPKTARIYLLNLRQKVKSSFALCSNGLLDGLLPNVLPTAILLGLSMDRGL